MKANMKSILQVTLIICIGLAVILPGCRRKKTTKEFVVARTENSSNIIKGLAEDEKNALMKKNTKTMNATELRQAKLLALADENLPLAATYLEHLIMKTTDQELLKEARLELADVHFELGNMDKAAQYYSTFVTLYPGSAQCEYAEYKAILCRFYAMLAPDRDQSKTKEALALARAYLEKGVYRTYVSEVVDIKRQCLNRLFESEAYIFDYHMKQGNFSGAKQRIISMRSEYEELVAEIEPNLLAFEVRLASRQGNDELRSTKEAELFAKYPDQAPTLLASGVKKKLNDYVMRF